MVVEVVYALPETSEGRTVGEKQWLVAVPFREGMTVQEAIEASGLLESVPNLEMAAVGIFGHIVPLEEKLRAGDRVELYRPLKCNPIEARRRRAKLSRKHRR